MSIGCEQRISSDSIGRDDLLVRWQVAVCTFVGALTRKGLSRAMTHKRGAIALATAALVLATVASCADNGNDPEASPRPTTSSPAPTTSSPTPQSESEKASEAASTLIADYYATVDKLSQDSNAPLGQLSNVATSLQLSAQRKLLKTQHENGQRQTGNTRVAQIQVQSVNLDNSDPKSGKVPTVEVDVCWDVSDVDVVDADGKSVVAPSRPDAGWTRLTVANYDYKSDPVQGWRVATGQDIERKPCVAS